MIYTNKKELAKSLWVCRITINRMLRDNEVKEIKNQRGKRIWYVKVIEMIKYLVQ